MTKSDIPGTPFQIAGVTMKNRHAFSPVTTAAQWDDRGRITLKLICCMEDSAKGDFGLLLTSAASI